MNDPDRAIRFLLADVDGTILTPDKVLTEAAEAAVREMRDAGILFTITSGRPPRGKRMLIDPLGLGGAISKLNRDILFNPDLCVIESHILDPETAQKAMTRILEPVGSRLGSIRRETG